jgi:hypothetical protein
MAKRKSTKDRHATQWPREKEQKTDMQYNGQEKRSKRQTCNTMGKRKGAKDRHAIQWAREKAIVLHVCLLYFFSWPLYCMSVFCTFSLAHCIACPSFVLFLLAIVLHVRLLYFFSCPLYCMSVFCTFSLAHCIACPSFVPFLLAIVLHVRLLYFFSCPLYCWPREKVQKTDMQYNGQEKRCKRQTCNTMAKRKSTKDGHAIQWPREKVQKTDMQYNGQEK